MAFSDGAFVSLDYRLISTSICSPGLVFIQTNKVTFKPLRQIHTNVIQISQLNVSYAIPKVSSSVISSVQTGLTWHTVNYLNRKASINTTRECLRWHPVCQSSTITNIHFRAGNF